MSYADTLSQHRRLVILRFLAEQPTYTLSLPMLHEMLMMDGAVPSSREQVEEAVAWLAEQELVETAIQPLGFVKVTARQRGRDVASGQAFLRGVRTQASQD